MKEIRLSGKYNYLVTKVDDKDYEWLSGIKWYGCKHPNGYVRVISGQAHHCQSMANILMGMAIQKDRQSLVDHINNDPLDNRKKNLRYCTPSQNTCNRKQVHKNKTSKYRGVSWLPQNQKWKSLIAKYRKHYHLGVFKSELAAALAYNKAAKKFHGEFAYLNFSGD